MTRVLSPEDLRCPVSGKLAWPTQDSALKALEKAWLRPQGDSPPTKVFPVRVYHCPDCGWWHLSSHWSKSKEER